MAKPDARTLALAAGWKALFLCSGIFVAGLDEATVAATDLQGGYPELQPHLAALPATIDRAQLQVRVAFDPLLPPRIAVRTDHGCTQLPIGMSKAAVGERPVITPSTGPSPLEAAELAAADARPWPLGDAEALVPHPAAAALARVSDSAFDGGFGQGGVTSAVVIVKDGKIVAERYRPGFDLHTPQRTWSVAKSLTSALLGRAQALALVDMSRPPLEDRPDPDARKAITIEQYLRMQSGLWTNGRGNRTDALYFGGATVRETAATAPMEAAPGSRFNYANNDTLMAALALDDLRLLEKRMAASIAALPTPSTMTTRGFAFDELLEPAGMTRTTIERDWQGNAILSSQVWMTARDLARLALLHLNDGQVPDGKGGMRRLLPEAWVKSATTPLGPQPEGKIRYGRAIWLMGFGDGLPAGSYGFLGNRGQIAIVVPSERLVVVRRGFDPAGVAFDHAAFTAQVIAALRH